MSSTPLSPSDLARLGQRAMRKRAELGLHCGPTPLGYRRVYSEALQTITIEPDPATAPIIERMYQWRQQGASVRTILDLAHREGLRSRRGTKLSVSAVQYILRSPLYGNFIRLVDENTAGGPHATAQSNC